MLTGNEKTSVARIKRALMENHGHTEDEAAYVVKCHREEIQKAIELGSFLYYPLGKILTAETHECDSHCVDFEDSE